MASKKAEARLKRLEASAGLSGDGKGGDRGDAYYEALKRSLRGQGIPPFWANIQRLYDKGNFEIVAMFDGMEAGCRKEGEDRNA